MVTTMGENKEFGSLPNLVMALIVVIGITLVSGIVAKVVDKKFAKLESQIEQAAQVSNNAEAKFKQLECLTRNIYWEAASEPFEGKVAVAQVTLNRVASGKFGSDICSTVYQKNIVYEKVICQFSWVCEGNWKIKPIMAKNYADSEEVAKKVLFENFRLPSLMEAMYFHADYVNPGWNKKPLAKIGRHVFYK
jgi:spore germination cell wall hydrolase CwlJ-like protein